MPEDKTGPGISGEIKGKEYDLDPYTEIGVSGLKRSGNAHATIDEEWLADLRGNKGVKIYREMADNNSTIGAILFTVDSFTRKLNWEVDAGDDSPQGKEAAEFVEGCLRDLDEPFANIMGEIVRGLIVYGWAANEMVYKMRRGDAATAEASSLFSDNRIGWAKLAGRSQDSLYDWEYNQAGDLEGMYQQGAPDYQMSFIPIEKMLLFRSTGTSKGNPEGRSCLRNCYISYYFLKRIQTSEAVGVSRSLAGLPKMTVPLRLLSSDATTAEKALLANFQQMVSRIKADEFAGLVLPAEQDDNGPTGYKFELLTGSTGKTADTNPIIDRLERNLARAFLADWMFLGSGTTGSWALASTKTNLFAQAIGGFLTSVVELFNDKAIPQLMRLNGIENPDLFPTIRHSDFEELPIDEVIAPLVSAVGQGLITPDDQLEQWIRESAGWPESEAAGFAPRTTPDDAQAEEDLETEADEQPEATEESTEEDPNALIERAPDEPISSVTLNGAQIASLLEIISQVGMGELPRESALEIISTAFSMPREAAEKLMGEVGRSFMSPNATGGNL